MGNAIYRKFKPFEVPKEWHYKDPDTGVEFSDSEMSLLQERIHRFRDQNKLEHIPALATVIENFTASKPENANITEHAPLTRGWLTYLKGGVALFKNMYFGDKNLVQQTEADRRALICTKCPLNIFPDKRGFLKWSDEIAESCTKGHYSSFHNELGNCKGCTCVLKAKVWLRGPFDLTKEEAVDMYKANPKCWQTSDLKDPTLLSELKASNGN